MCSTSLPRPGEPSEERQERLRSRKGLTWIWHLVYIVYCVEVGGFLLVLPWFNIWDNNYLLYRYPLIRPIVANAFLKGAVVGLGIVNILIGIREIASFKKSSKGYFPK
jgi:hypothetical protein